MKRMSLLYCMLCLGFLLGIHNGRVALWKDEDPKPIRVFPYYASSLPKKDQKALKQGIPIDTVEDLRNLLEDYLS